MSLAHPALTTLGRSRARKKFSSAEEARKHRELQAEWEKKQREWNAMSVTGSKSARTATSQVAKPQSPAPYRRTTKQFPSLDTGITGAVSSKPTQKYTGTKMLGISQMAKSNAVPVFSKEEAIEIARMRRG